MTTYGTIPTAELVSHAKDLAKSALATRRPWKEMVHLHAFGLPATVGEALMRVQTNLAYFRMNYAIAVLVVVFLSLLWHPVSLIVLVVMVAAWIFLYFLRDEPLVVLGREVGNGVVLGLLSVVTIVALFLTQATLNLIVSLLIGAALVVAHAALRRTDDLFAEKEGMYSVVVESGASSSS